MDPASAVALPGSQGRQTSAAPREYVPGAHDQHERAPRGEKDPAGHGVQLMDPCSPLKEPGGHSTHEVCPFARAYVPVGQAMHAF